MGDRSVKVQRQVITIELISKHNNVHVKAEEEIDFESPQLGGLV